jgi:tripartite-type tricarboxylate transporter receptor subunit TctC
VQRVNTEINKFLSTPAGRDRLTAIGADPTPSTPEAFASLIKSENVKWADVIKRSGAKID